MNTSIFVSAAVAASLALSNAPAWADHGSIGFGEVHSVGSLAISGCSASTAFSTPMTI